MYCYRSTSSAFVDEFVTLLVSVPLLDLSGLNEPDDKLHPIEIPHPPVATQRSMIRYVVGILCQISVRGHDHLSLSLSPPSLPSIYNVAGVGMIFCLLPLLLVHMAQNWMVTQILLLVMVPVMICVKLNHLKRSLQREHRLPLLTSYLRQRD